MTPGTQQWITLRHIGELLARTGDDRTTAILLGALTNQATAAPVFGADATRLDDLRRGPLPPHHYRAPSGTGLGRMLRRPAHPAARAPRPRTGPHIR